MVYRVHYVGRQVKRWHVTKVCLDGRKILQFLSETKAHAISIAAEEARAVWKLLGDLTQVVVHAKDGRICFERTYGKDPARRKG